jgi:small conductance mechanosensitive channel
MEDILKKVLETVALYGPKFLGGLAVLIIGSMVIKGINKSVRKLLEKKEISPTLIPFIRGIVSVLLKILLIVSVMAMMGIEMLSFSALIGAVGLAIGMALSGTLQNFAGGVLILILKPYKPGDYIEAQGYAGTVSQIQIFNTILKTPDNKVIIIPNGGLSTGSMINYSYGDSADKAKEVLQRLCDEDERILKDPPVFIGLSKLDNSSVNFVVRAWVKTPDYWGVFFDMNEKVYHTFEKEGLSIPFPQMDVHLHNK